MSKPRTTNRSSSWLIVVLMTACVVGGFLVVGRITSVPRPLDGGRERSASPPVAPRGGVAARSPKSRPGKEPQSSPNENLLIDDDGRALWMSPTEGEPLDLAYLPPGVQLIVALRPEALAEHPESAKVFAALGPLGRRAARVLDELLRNPHGVHRLVLGCQGTNESDWEVTLVAEFSGRRSAAAHFAAAFPDAVEKSVEGKTYWIAGRHAYYVPRGNERVLVVAPESLIGDILDLRGEAPPLRRDVERLLAHSDRARQVTIVVAPNWLFSDGRGLFEGELAGLRGPLFWFLGDELSAAAISMHWDKHYFVELAATATLDTRPEDAAEMLMRRLEGIPSRIEHYVAGLEAEPYGREIVARFPSMLGAMVDYTRAGVEGDVVMLRCYLPTVAGHNLLAGAELTLAHRPHQGVRADEASAAIEAPAGDGASVRQRLERVTSLRFARDTLGAAVEMLARDVGVPIVIRGADLQAEGITKNQSFGIDLENRPAKEILIQVLRLANPDRSASGAADARQKLVYVIRPGDAASAESVVITTRSAAAARGEALPAVFRESGR